MREVRQRRLRRTVGVAVVLVVLLVGGIAVSGALTTSSPSKSTTPTSSASGTASSSAPPSIEAGLEAWNLPGAISRETVIANGSGLTVLGGLAPSGSSVSGAYTIDPTKGAFSSAGSLPTPVHDASGDTLGHTSYVFGGGSPDTVASIQSIPTPTIPPSGSGTGSASSSLPQPRSDSATVAISTGRGSHASKTLYVVGGYDGTTYLPSVLATTDGVHFHSTANLSTPVRYPAVVAESNKIFVFGGQVPSSGTSVVATDVIQEINLSTHRTTVVGHLAQPMYGAAAFLIGTTIYVAGGQVPNGPTLTAIDAFVPATHRLLNAGLLPQADAFGGYATVGSGAGATGYIVGGEVASQTGDSQAGVASGTLSSVIALRTSGYGGPAGTTSAGSPFVGTLLIADRGNNRLIAINPARQQTWVYPSPTMPPPPGGFYFPDDSFFFNHGTGIISNQEDNHTIVEIGYPSGKILWQYGKPGQPGSAPGYLNQPDDAYLLKNGTITVADASNNRILFLSPAGQVLSQIGNGTDAHNPPTSIAYPNGDTPLANGDILVSEIDGSWVDEYTQAGKLVWTVHMDSVNYPSDPQQLGSNLYLMTDYNPPGEGRILEFTRQGQTVWRYDALSGDAMLKKPSLAERLPNGLIMVNDDYRNRVVVLNPANNTIVWQYGITDVSGTAPGMLSIPDGFDLLLADKSTPTHPQTG